MVSNNLIVDLRKYVNIFISKLNYWYPLTTLTIIYKYLYKYIIPTTQVRLKFQREPKSISSYTQMSTVYIAGWRLQQNRRKNNNRWTVDTLQHQMSTILCNSSSCHHHRRIYLYKCEGYSYTFNVYVVHRNVMMAYVLRVYFIYWQQ